MILRIGSMAENSNSNDYFISHLTEMNAKFKLCRVLYCMRFPPSRFNLNSLMHCAHQRTRDHQNAFIKLEKQPSLQNRIQRGELESLCSELKNIFTDIQNLEPTSFRFSSDIEKTLSMLNQYLQQRSQPTPEQYLDVIALRRLLRDKNSSVVADEKKIPPCNLDQEFQTNNIQELQIEKLKAERNQLINIENKTDEVYEKLIQVLYKLHEYSQSTELLEETRTPYSQKPFQLIPKHNYKKEAEEFEYEKERLLLLNNTSKITFFSSLKTPPVHNTLEKKKQELTQENSSSEKFKITMTF